MSNMSNISLKTLLLSLNTENNDLRNYAKQELKARYGDEIATLVSMIMNKKEIVQEPYKRISEIPDVDQDKKNELISEIALAHEEKKMPMKNIMELYHSDNTIIKNAAMTVTVAQFTDYVRFLIHRHYSSYADKYFDDLFNSGICGLLTALNTYDDTTFSFTTYSKKYIIHEISRQVNFYRNDSSPHFNKLQKTIKDAIDRLNNEGLEVTEQRIAIITELKPNVIRREMSYIERTKFRYLDDENDTTINEIESGYDATPEAIAEKNEKNMCLMSCLDSLADEEKSVLLLKFADKYTNEEIANALGLSISDVKTYSHRGLQKMKHNPKLLKAFPEYKTDAEAEMKKYVFPILPTEEEIAENLQTLLDIDFGYNDYGETEAVSSLW